MALPDTRREYSLGGLDRDDLAADPLAQFTRWFADASALRPDRRGSGAGSMIRAGYYIPAFREMALRHLP